MALGAAKKKNPRFEATRGASFKKSLKSATSHHACSADLRNGREVLDRRKNHLFVGFEADDDGIEGSVTGSSRSKLSYPSCYSQQILCLCLLTCSVEKPRHAFLLPKQQTARTSLSGARDDSGNADAVIDREQRRRGSASACSVSHVSCD